MDFGTHLRRTFLTGLFAAIPLGVTAWAIWFVDKQTRVFSPKIFGWQVPLLGVVIVLVAVYLLGLLVSTALAKWFLARLDSLLERLPMVRPAYRAWKQVSLNQGPGGAGMWDRVVLVGLEGEAATLGFTSGHGVEGADGALSVFLPSAPAPTTGRLLFVPRERCRLLDVTPEEAFKYILSGGNYVPPGTGTAWRELSSQKPAEVPRLSGGVQK